MSKKIRVLSLLLCFAMTFGIVSCGNSEQPVQDTTDATGIGDTSSGETLTSGVTAGTTFGGATVRILNGQYHEKFLYLVNASEATGDTLNDAVYKRNLAVQEKLDVKFEYTDYFGWESDPVTIKWLRQATLANDQEWDIIHDVETSFARTFHEQLLADLIDAPYIDINQPWWNKNYMDAVSISDDHRYLLTGEFSIGHINQISTAYFNKSIYEDYFGDPDEMYDLVLDGKWTLDKMNEMISKTWKDENGNSKIDFFDDTIGFSSPFPTTILTYHLFYSAGATFTSYDENGTPYIDGMNERNVAIAEKIYNLFFNTSGFCASPSEYKEALDNIIPQRFSEGGIFLYLGFLNNVELLRNMDADFGILPYPKYDESEEGYHALVHNQSATLAIPLVTSTYDMACAVMEELAFEGYRTMMPEYYSVALNGKYIRDNDNDKAMKVFDLIINNATTDLLFTFQKQANGIGICVYHMISEGSKNYVSKYDSMLPAAKEQFGKLLEIYG